MEGLPSHGLLLLHVFGRQFCFPSELRYWSTWVPGKFSVVLIFQWITEYLSLTENLQLSLVGHVHVCTFFTSYCVCLWSVCLHLISLSCLTASFILKASEQNQILLLLFLRIHSSKITPVWETHTKKMFHNCPRVGANTTTSPMKLLGS